MALTLNRRIGETIVIGDGIVVRVERIDRSQVRLAIQAPEDVSIRRGELDAERKTE